MCLKATRRAHSQLRRVKKPFILARRRDTFGHGEELCFCCVFCSFLRPKSVSSVPMYVWTNSLGLQKVPAMRMNEEDGKKLMSGLGEIRNLGAELEALDYENDPDALSKEMEIMDLMMTCSMTIAPLRKELSTGDSVGDAKSAPEQSGAELSRNDLTDPKDKRQKGETN